MRAARLFVPWVLLAAAMLARQGVACAAAPRFAALLSSGQRIQGQKLSDWHDKSAQPRLDGQPLLEPSNAIRWLRDRSLRQAEMPPAYIEMHGGDRFPGTAIDYGTGHEQPFRPLPPHLIVRSAIRFEPPENKPVSEIRIALPLVRRIVWQRRGRMPYQPGRAFFRDGRSLAFRAARFSSGQVHFLLADGESRRLSWSDLAEVHMPELDEWSAWCDEMAQLLPSADTRLLQIETTGGLVATTSLARLAPRFEGNSSESDRWVHGIQPAWSLDILWVPCREMVYRRSWLPREFPLSRLTPHKARGMWTRNQNELGGPLQSKTQEFGWGYGLHSGCELAFAIPPGARSFRAQVCLDRIAGKGGCARVRLFVNNTSGGTLWESPVLVGSETVVDTGPLALTGPPGQHELLVVVDAVDRGKPVGADPLDIRDHVNLCDATFEVDPAALQQEIDRRLARRIFAWNGWAARLIEAATPAEAGLEFSVQRHERLPVPGTFHLAVQAKTKPFSLVRQLQIGPEHRWFVVAAARSFNRGQEPKLEVRIGGELVGEFSVPERQNEADETRPLVVSLAGFQRTSPFTADVEVRQLAAADSAPVEYRTIELAEQLPGLWQIFEEQGRPAAIDPAASGTAAIAAADRHYGTRALKLTPAGEFRLALPQSLRIRERPAWGEYRFLRFAFKKTGGGQFALGFEAADLRESPPRYDLGPGPPAYGAATRIWKDPLPKDWVVQTRDLYADFGNLDVRALTAGSPDGESLLIDHIYLARSHKDFETIPAAPSPEVTNDKARQELLRPISEETRPACVRIDFEDGRRAAGVVISKEGEILTAGHAVIGPGRKARVMLHDGTEVKATTKGVSREMDLGLLVIEPPGKFRRLEPHPASELPQDQPYIATFQPRMPGEFAPASTDVVQIRRVVRNTVWIDLDEPDWIPGGALVDRKGHLVGIQVRPSRFGGTLCTRFKDLDPQFPRMRNGEVFGGWPLGAEPQLGLSGSGVKEGHKIALVAEGGPAAKAGLQVGDIVTKINGQSVATAEDLHRALAERDAGQEIALDYLRGTASQQAKLQLSPRDP
jgi:hypothetical protein